MLKYFYEWCMENTVWWLGRVANTAQGKPECSSYYAQNPTWSTYFSMILQVNACFNLLIVLCREDHQYITVVMDPEHDLYKQIEVIAS